MQNIAQGWLVYQLALHEYGPGKTSFYVGLVSAIGMTPTLLFTLFAGVIADRFDKRRILIATQSGAMLLALTLGVLYTTGMIHLWHIMVLAALLGLVFAFDMPTRQAFVKDMVGPEDLVNAIALNSSIFNGARIVGPGIAGVLIAIPSIGYAGAFFANAASYLAVIAGIVAIRLTPHPRALSEANVWEHMREGFRYVIGHRTIRLILVVMAIISVFGFSYIVEMPVIVGQVLHRNVGSYGLLLSFGGAGALIATLILATMAGRVRKGAVMLYGSLLFSLALIAMKTTTSFYVFAVFLSLVSGGLVVCSASINSLIQEITPDHLRGRVISMWAFIFAGFAPVGALYAGTLAHYSTPTMPVFVGGIVILLLIIFLSLRAPWIWRLE